MKRSAREELKRAVERFDAGRGPRAPTERLEALLDALAEEDDPPTAVSTPDRAIEVHVADSLAGLEASPVLDGRTIADIGAGAGFPGLVLAIALPAASVDLIESSARKCAVIDRLIAAAEIANARSVPERAEALAAGARREAYDVVTARAVASLPVLVEYASPLLRAGGALVAWKGRRDPEEERAGAAGAAQVGMALDGVIRVEPFPAARDRHLHVYTKRGPTPAGLPRRPGRAAKRPLA